MCELKHGERLRMRNWLEQVINSEEFPGVEWIDRRRCKFRVPWKHASRHGWDIEKDASIFKMWAVYTGKFPDNCRELTQKEMKGQAKVWKANFRCALNALQDVQVVREEGQSKGKDAFKVFQILPRKAKSRSVRLNSQGSEENSLTIKIRKRSTTTTKTCNSSLKKQKEKEDEEESSFSPHFEHNYSASFPSFNMKNGTADASQHHSGYTSPYDVNYMMQNISMFNNADTGVSCYSDGVQYASSEEFDSNSSNGSDAEHNNNLVAQLLAQPSYNLTSLNIDQTVKIVGCSSQEIQQAIKPEYANEYQASMEIAANTYNNVHFKEGAIDPFCGGYDTKELSLALQFKI